MCVLFQPGFCPPHRNGVEFRLIDLCGPTLRYRLSAGPEPRMAAAADLRPPWRRRRSAKRWELAHYVTRNEEAEGKGRVRLLLRQLFHADGLYPPCRCLRRACGTAASRLQPRCRGTLCNRSETLVKARLSESQRMSACVGPGSRSTPHDLSLQRSTSAAAHVQQRWPPARLAGGEPARPFCQDKTTPDCCASGPDRPR